MSSSSERAVLATVSGLNHAVRINGNYVYASNATMVFRWPYQAGDRSNLGPFEIVIKNIPCCHHVTRSLAFDKNNLLYVQVGSGSNVDPDTTHARINQFDIYSQPIPSGGIDFNSGFVYVNGVRNEVGIRFDQNWNLWGVENGVDDEYRAGLFSLLPLFPFPFSFSPFSPSPLSPFSPSLLPLSLSLLLSFPAPLPFLLALLLLSPFLSFSLLFLLIPQYFPCFSPSTSPPSLRPLILPFRNTFPPLYSFLCSLSFFSFKRATFLFLASFQLQAQRCDLMGIFRLSFLPFL